MLVEVRAALGLDRGTWHTMTGRPYLMRIMGFGLRSPKNRACRTRRRLQLAVAIGCQRDPVHGRQRSLRRQPGAPSPSTPPPARDKLAHKPSTLTFEQAAAVPVSATTALQGLLALGRIEAGQEVLIIGASGGVGTYAVQLAKALGAEVTGVCSAGEGRSRPRRSAPTTRSTTTEDVFADGAARYDLILDIAGTPRSRGYGAP